MAYSNKINTPFFRSFRTKQILKKSILFLCLPPLFCLTLLHSKYCPDLLAPVFTAVLALFLWFKLRIFRLFWPNFDGEVVKITVRRTELLRTFSENERIRGSTISGLGSPKMKFSVGSSFMNESDSGVMNILRVRREDNGKIYRFSYTQRILPGVPLGDELFPVGTKVRYHRGLSMVEKEDKSHDQKLLCLSCMCLTNCGEEDCWHCGAPNPDLCCSE